MGRFKEDAEKVLKALQTTPGYPESYPLREPLEFRSASAASSYAQAWARSQALAQSSQSISDLRGVASGKVGYMNWAYRLGAWIESKRVIRRAEFDLFKHNVHETLKEDRKTSVAKDVADLKVRMDRLELYVGLKREPKPQVVPGEARIA